MEMTNKLNLFQNVTLMNRRFTFLGGTGYYTLPHVTHCPIILD